MITAEHNRKIVNENLANTVRNYAEGELQTKINEAVANNKFEVKVTPPVDVSAAELTKYVSEYGYTTARCGYDVIVKW